MSPDMKSSSKHRAEQIHAPALQQLKLLCGQKALVTGANSGIGRAVAIGLARAGADVAVNYITNEDAAKEVVEVIVADGGRACAVRADVACEGEVQEMFDTVRQKFGHLDILVNNAGCQAGACIEDMSLAQWNTVISTNLTGQFLCMREAIREFKRHGVIEHVSVSAGKIICISSIHEAIPYAGNANYAASKGGVMQLMKSVAQEVGPHRIRVNSICPGIIETAINTLVWQDSDKKNIALKAIPCRRIGQPDDIARLAVFLASDEADYITGASIFADGGISLYSGLRELVRENLALKKELAAVSARE